MSRLSRTALAAASAVAAVLIAVPCAALAAAPPPSTTSNIAKGAAGWLAQQLVNGNHVVFSFDGKTFDAGGTADAMFALAASGTGEKTINAAADYLAKHLNAYVDYSKNFGGPFYGSVGKAAVAAIVAGRNPNNFGGHHLLAELKADECQTGDDSCTPGNNSNTFSSVSTSFIVIAEARGAKRFAPSGNLTHFFLSLQCADGGFSSDLPVDDPCKPDVDATGYALMALRALGGHSVAKHAAEAWLFKQRNRDGSWTAQGGKDIDSTALAVAGLYAGGRKAPESVAWLRGQQVTSGPTVGNGARRGALKYQGKFDSSASTKATSDGILGIARGDLATLVDTHAAGATRLLALPQPHLRHAKVARGHSETVTGHGFAANERVRASIHGRAVHTATTDKSGTVSQTFTVPTSLSSGKHTIVLTGHRSQLHGKVSFTVR